MMSIKTGIILIFLLPLSVQALLLEKIVAVIDNEIITLSDMEKYRSKLKGGKLDDDLLKPNKALLLKESDRLLDHMINERILDGEVKKNGLSITIERVEQEIRKIAQQNKIDRAHLKIALAQEGVAFSAYQDFIKTRLERQSLIEKEVSSKIKISEDDIVAYYTSKKGNLSKETFEYTVAHILFVPKEGDSKGALVRAEQVALKLKEGASFEDLASQYSEDPNFESGGLLGTFKAGEMLSSLEEPITALEVNQYSKIIKSRLGFHLLKLLKKRIVSDPQFLREKAEIHAHLFQAAFSKQFDTWLMQKRQETFIRKNK